MTKQAQDASGVEEQYVFRLREDMPPGFIENTVYPELPAINRFLQQYKGQIFGSEAEFQKVLDGVHEYFEAQNVQASADKALRQGLHVQKVEGRDFFAVYCDSDLSPADRCVFGTLRPAQ